MVSRDGEKFNNRGKKEGAARGSTHRGDDQVSHDQEA